MVAGWDEHAQFAAGVRNYTKRPIDLEIRRPLPGNVVFRSSLPAKNHDFQTVQYTASVPPGAKADLQYRGHSAPGPQREAEPFGCRGSEA